jgi:hypothetical protein
MSVISADTLRNLSNNELRAQLTRRFRCYVESRANKTQLVGRLLIEYAKADPTATIKGTFYDLLPRNRKWREENDVGLVSNLPVSYQNRVCEALADELRGNIYPCKMDVRFRHYPGDTYHYGGNMNHPLDVADPRAVLRRIIHEVMTGWQPVAELTAYYTGFTRTAFHKNNWTWVPDNKGRVFVEVLVDYILARWSKAVEKHRQDIIRYNNPEWGFDDPFRGMADDVERLIEDKRIRIAEKRRLCHIMRTTFLYGCSSKHSGSRNLRLISARYAYGPVRKQIAEYVGAIDAE